MTTTGKIFTIHDAYEARVSEMTRGENLKSDAAFREMVDGKLKAVTELGEAQLTLDVGRLTRKDLLEMLQLLSALESWSFSLKVELPDYLQARLDTQIERIKAEILGGVTK